MTDVESMISRRLEPPEGGMKNRIAFRLSLLTSLLIAFGFGVLSTGYYYYSKSQIQLRMKVEAEASLRLASASLAQALWAFDGPAMENITQSLIIHSEGDIVALRVLNPQGKELVRQVSAQFSSLDFDSLKTLPDHSRFARPLLYQGQVLGEVDLICSQAGTQHKIIELFRLMVGFTVIISLFCSVWIFLLTHRLLNAPIEKLIHSADKIRNGHYDIPEENFGNEFQILSDAFVSAAREIQARDDELKLRAENLESEVEQRTRELDQQRMNMVNSSHLASLGEISAGIAHEINNPLAVIQGKTEMILKKNRDDPALEKDLKKIIQMVTRISKIVRGLRTFARDGSTDPKFHFKVRPFLDDLAALCQARVRNHDIEFKMECPEHLEGCAREVQISQVLINLINNSIDAVESLDEKWIRLEVFERGPNLVFAVTDSGFGIPEAIRMKIMEPFFTTKKIGSGTGLGLSISIGIARDHGGDLVYDATSPNTRFELIIPQSAQRSMAA